MKSAVFSRAPVPPLPDYMTLYSSRPAVPEKEALCTKYSTRDWAYTTYGNARDAMPSLIS